MESEKRKMIQLNSLRNRLTDIGNNLKVTKGDNGSRAVWAVGWGDKFGVWD